MNLKFTFSKKLGLLLVAVACAHLPAVSALGAGIKVRAIHVISSSWHTSVVVKRQDIVNRNVSELVDCPSAKYMEFGWGDAEYFSAKQTTFGMTMRAAFTSMPAVIHVVGSFRHPTSQYPTAEIVELSTNPDGLKNLVQYIHDLFERIHVGGARFSDPGLYTKSMFYLATSTLETSVIHGRRRY